jgi:hypothetical protein
MLDDEFRDPAHADGARYLRRIGVLGLALGTSNGFALRP